MPQDDPQITQPESGAISAFIAEMNRFPVWTLGDVAKVAGIAFLALFFSFVLSVMIASGLPWFRGQAMNSLLMDARLAVPAQLLAYAITFWFVYRLIVHHYGIPFGEGVRWRWPGNSWLAYVLGGLVLCLLIQVLGRFLPQPKHVPLQDLFRTQLSAWILTIFGIFIGPPAEELFFRGLLFPALERKVKFTWSVFLTAVAFTALHGFQLDFGWGPLLGIFIVGVVLTVVRAKADSLAASVIVHVTYNLVTFGIVIYATQGYRHLERITGT